MITKCVKKPSLTRRMECSDAHDAHEMLDWRTFERGGGMLMARAASDIRRSFLPFYRGARLRMPGVQGVQTRQTHLRRETVVLWSSFVFLHTLHTLHTFYKKVLYVVYIE